MVHFNMVLVVIVAISDGILLMGGSGTVSGVSRLATVSSRRMRGPLTQEAGPGLPGPGSAGPHWAVSQ